jgi:hypothetical protein
MASTRLLLLVPLVLVPLAALAMSAFDCSPGGGVPQEAGLYTPTEAGPCSKQKDGGQATPSGSSLVSLEVKAKGGSSSSLIPAFSPDVSDYYLRCATGTNTFTVTVKAATGAKASLALETPARPSGVLLPMGSAAAEQTLSMSLLENQAIVATATAADVSQEYWVRCLPHDVSPMLWDAKPNCTRTPGYYLVGNEQPPIGGVAYTLVLDTNGVPVWYYPISSTSGVYDVDQIVPGKISFERWPMTDGFEFHELDPASTTTLTPIGDWWPNPHEIRPLANGHFVEFTTTPQTGMDLTGFNVMLPDGGTQSYGPDTTMLPCTILEVDPEGKVVWTWVGTDHIDPVKDNELAELLSAGGMNLPDPYHCNSIDVDPANQNLLVSSREEDSIFYIDRSTGAVLWKMGGSDLTKDHAQYIPLAPADTFQLQHDARLMPGWSPTCGGQITLFDDEWSVLGIPSRAVVYNVTLNGNKPNGEKCGTVGATLAWQYRGTKTAAGMGSFRITSDGSRIIGWGHGGVPGLIFTEVDAELHDLLDLYFTDESASYRAIKLPLSTFDISVFRNNAGLIGP